VPNHNQWQPHLPFYGPSLTQIKKVQILPPSGPLPALKESTPDILYDSKQQNNSKSKPGTNEPSAQSDRNENNWSFERRSTRPEITTSSPVRVHLKPKQRLEQNTNKTTRRPKKKQKNVTTNQTTRSPNKLTSRPPETSTQLPETTTSSLDIGPQPRHVPQNHEPQRIKLTRNGKRLGPKDSKIFSHFLLLFSHVII
jgi:hypothetical protein